ncbi:YihA family ribosome biogenesis GTP-binding protein [Pelobium manganitolerans]|uniref:Probable GTP-binding protein EngB n=1 Tax=Pelobium manganitolerans TaxID=1842495 RepID=A0A419S384_9SPHI|nr:ribosome biogenesis GTP-binding protein YihA/YsxC [Pelobium manganitolerans]RKD13744.1 YihA family ribosome biogenesis GTP-binding protein [Pelobium manganitolerans]
MIIKSAVFTVSNTKISKLPAPDMPEYAFIGRSNVGKSSLINMITGVKGLAKTSQKPGKTQLINHFLINESWYIVDLPGYGYAKSSKSNRLEWAKFIRHYLDKRENLQCVFVLIDSRLEPQKIDIEFCCSLGERGIPFILVFTKADKQNRSKSAQAMEQFKKALLAYFEEVPQMILTSAENGTGKDEVLTLVDDINQRFEAPKLAKPEEQQ